MFASYVLCKVWAMDLYLNTNRVQAYMHARRPYADEMPKVVLSLHLDTLRSNEIVDLFPSTIKCMYPLNILFHIYGHDSIQIIPKAMHHYLRTEKAIKYTILCQPIVEDCMTI